MLKSSRISNSNTLPVLHRVLINTPCPKDWNEMAGDSRKRFCGHCQKYVHNLSEMESNQIQDLLKTGDSICVKLSRRSDGSIITKDEVSSAAHVRSPRWVDRLIGMAASLAAVLFIGGCNEETDQITGESPPSTATSSQLLGKVTTQDEIGDVMVTMPEVISPRKNKAERTQTK